LYAGFLPVGDISGDKNAIEMSDFATGTHATILRDIACGQPVDGVNHSMVDHGGGHTVGAPEMRPGNTVMNIGGKDELQDVILAKPECAARIKSKRKPGCGRMTGWSYCYREFICMQGSTPTPDTPRFLLKFAA
jgi:hypothetical protein